MTSMTAIEPAVLLALALTACVPDDGHGDDADPTDLTVTSAATVIGADPPGLDSTGATVDPCADDYDGNHDLASAHPLLLDTTEVALAVIGDGILSGASSEQGQDQLAVCDGRPDFFSFDATCPSYLVVDSHGTLDGDIDLLVNVNGFSIAEAIGTWKHFFVKPVMLPIGAGAHTLEVRYSGSGAPAYVLHVHVLPIAPCS